jgi:hypothetical protein
MPTYDQVPGDVCYECEKKVSKEIAYFDKYEGPYLSGVPSSNYISPSGVYFNFTSDCGPR